MAKKLIFLIAFLGIASQFILPMNSCWGATYYLRNDGTAANKAAATSCSAASTAMNEPVHNAQAFSAGDTICLCSDGGSFNSEIAGPSSGSSGSNIVYNGDCDGDGTTAKIDGGSVIAALISFNGRSYIEIKNIEGTGSTDNGIFLRNAQYFWIYDNNIHHNPNGIRVRAKIGQDIHDIFVYDNTVNYNSNGIYFDTESAAGLNHDNEIYNNTANFNGTSGIRLNGTSYNNIVGKRNQPNTIWYTGNAAGTSPTFGTGISTAGIAANFPYDNTIQYNNVQFTEDVDADGTDGVGIRMDNFSRTSTAQYNFVANNEGNGMASNNNAGYGNDFIGNMIINNNTGSATWPNIENAGIHINDGTVGVGIAGKAYHNTIMGGDRCIYVFGSFASPEIKNNICYDQAAEGFLIEKVLFDAGNYTESNNLIFSEGTFALASIETFTTIVDQEASLDASTKTGDPLFINPGGTTAKDFRIKQSSPAYQGCPGADLSGTVDNDYCGLPFIPGCYPIGAHRPSENMSYISIFPFIITYSPGGTCQ